MLLPVPNEAPVCELEADAITASIEYFNFKAPKFELDVARHGAAALRSGATTRICVSRGSAPTATEAGRLGKVSLAPGCITHWATHIWWQARTKASPPDSPMTHKSRDP